MVNINAKQMADDFEKMIWHLDEPIADFSALNVMYISELAKKNGIKVLLSGLVMIYLLDIEDTRQSILKNIGLGYQLK